MAYTVDQVVKIASKRTNYRADNPDAGGLDLVAEFWLAFQEFCMEEHFWWRKKTLTFSTVAGTATYDLAGDSPLPDADDFYEMIELRQIDSATDQTEITPIVDQSEQLSALANTVQDSPARYMIEPNTTQTVRFQAPPNAIKNMRGLYWALPNPAADETGQAIPLIPPQLHWGLPIMLQRVILEFLFGELDPRYLVVDRRYERFLKAASRSLDFTTGAQRAISTTAGAVRAHN